MDINFKTTKKGLLLLSFAAAIFLLVLAGCSKNNTLGMDYSYYSNELLEKNTLTVATSPDYEPYEFIRDGELVGFDIDFINLVAKELKLKLNIVYMPFDDIFKEVKSGENCDCAISSIAVTPERQKNFILSDIYYHVSTEISDKQDCVIVLSKDRANLLNAIDKIILIKKEDGSIEEIKNR